MLLEINQNQIVAQIIDVTGFSLKHFMKVTANFATVKLYLKFVQEAAPLRIVQNHFINCNPIIDKLMILARPFIRKELFDVIHFHKPNSETLYNFISRDELPKDYGGNLDTIENIYSDWITKVQRKRYVQF
jgi:CRAL/TRIO domain